MRTKDEIEQFARLYAEQLGVDPDQFLNQLKSRYGQNYEQLAAMSSADLAEALGSVTSSAAAAPAPVQQQAPTAAANSIPGLSPDKAIMPPPAQAPVADPNYKAPTIPNSQKFSQFDDVFKKYAGTLAGDSDFMRIVNATVKAESGMNPNAMGDNGHSIGLFQMHDQGAGAGMSAADRADPDKASAVMIPRFVAMYQQGKQQGLTGTDLASYVSRNVERPLGFEDPNGAAARKYVSAYQELGGQLGSAYPGAENDTGGPNPFQWKSQGQNYNGDTVVARPFGTVGINDMTKAELARYFAFDGSKDAKESAYNLVTSNGINPYSNIYQKMYMDTAEDLGKQAYIKNILDTGQSGDYGSVANAANGALRAGKMSLYDDPHDIINQLKNLGASNGVGLQGDRQSLFDQYMAPGKEDAAARLLAGMIAPTMALGLQKYLPETMQRNLLQVKQQLPGQNVNPFVALARQMGY